MKKQKEDLAYLDDAKALEEKEAGTALFKEGKFPDAIKRYTESSLKRNPKDHTVYCRNFMIFHFKFGPTLPHTAHSAPHNSIIFF